MSTSSTPQIPAETIQFTSLPDGVNKLPSVVNDRETETDADDCHSSVPAVSLDQRFITKVEAVIPKKREEVLKWYGWGYKDSEFYVKDDLVHFRGDKYPLKGCALPYFTDWVKNTFQVDIEDKMPAPTLPSDFPKPIENLPFLEELKRQGISYSLDGIDRYIRCHGQTLHDIYYICKNRFKRIPDIVVWPTSHNEVEQLVAIASKSNVVVLPYGGGTSVSGAATCPQNESRTMCIVDTTQMNSMLWLNKRNLTACFEAGIVGQDLERVLYKEGLTLGHEPDSYEFSTLGGWIATRASGMKKNVYGNIEDLVVSVKMVTPIGTLLRSCNAPRVSCGPDFNHVILGSEGTLGVITEVILKVRPIPSVKRYGSLVFPNFESGVAFMREVARRRCQPASVRLMDNEQFILGQTMKPMKGWTGNLADYLKKVYLTSVKRLHLNRICAATLLFEGELKDIERQESVIYEIAKQYNGFSAGSENGKKGYILTFVIAYVRDIGIAYDVVAESFETSVPWDRCSALCQNVKNRVQIECRSHQIFYFIISCRVTQTYDAGACVYFYFAFRNPGFTNPVDLYETIEASAREEILASGGSLSHHHGVGKIRSRWYKNIVTPIGTTLYKAIKRQLDPKNIFGFNNLLQEEKTLHNPMAKL